jgi:hypothetical protein
MLARQIVRIQMSSDDLRDLVWVLRAGGTFHIEGAGCVVEIVRRGSWWSEREVRLAAQDAEQKGGE